MGRGKVAEAEGQHTKNRKGLAFLFFPLGGFLFTFPLLSVELATIRRVFLSLKAYPNPSPSCQNDALGIKDIWNIVKMSRRISLSNVRKATPLLGLSMAGEMPVMLEGA